jgi:nucleoside-diphosphate-sugar epimerase
VKVLVTGSAGFLGRRFYRLHRDAGDRVVGVDNLSGNDLDESCVDYAADATSVFQEYDYDLAYHFAAPVGGRLKIEGDPMFNADSLRLDSAFFRWAAAGHCQTLVYPSSSAVYGTYLQDSDGKPLVEGDMEFKGGGWWYPPDEMYGFTKLAGEYLAWKAERYGVRTLCIRPFSGYGEGQSFDYPIPSIAARALRRENPLTIWGSGQQTRDFIHVDDIVRITCLAAGFGIVPNGTHGYHALNLGSGVATTFYEVAALFAEIVGYEPVIVSDETKPQGVYKRYADIGRQRQVSKEPLISLREGLTRVLADVEQRLAVAAE